MVQAVCTLLLLLGAAAPGYADFLQPYQIDALYYGTNPLPYEIAVNPVTNKIYVTNYGDNNVTVIDGATDTLSFVAAGSYPKALAVNTLTNTIYVVNYDKTVTVIDGATNATTTVSVGAGPIAIAVNPVTNKIYVANEDDNDVTVIDGATNATTTVAAGTGPTAVAVNTATNKIYVANYDSNTVEVIDGSTNATTPIAPVDSPLAIAVNPVTNKIYVTNEGSGTLTEIDGATNSPTPITVGTSPGAVAVNPVTNKIYVANQGGNVTEIDGASHSTRNFFGSQSFIAVAVDPVTDTAYAISSDGGFGMIDASATGGYFLGGTNGTGPTAIAVNPVTNRVYVPYGGSNTVGVFAGASGAPKPIDAGAGQIDGAVNPVTDKIYLTQPANNQVLVIDGSNNFTTTVPVGQSPEKVAVNPVTNRIYVTNEDDNTVSVIDGTNDTVITTVTMTGDTPFALAVNPVTNKIYVVNYDGGNVTVIDGATNSTTNVPAGTNPYGVAVNVVTNKVYVANYGSNNVTVIDGSTNATTPVAAEGGPISVAVNSVTNRIYVANVSSNDVTVIDGVTNFTTSISGLPVGPTSIAVNSIANTIYVVCNSGYVVRIDGDDNSWISAAANLPGNVTVDPITNKTYVTQVEDASIAEFDGVSQDPAAGTIDTGNNPSVVAVNPITHVVYVANAGDAFVTSFSQQNVQSIPLVTTIAPLPDNQTVNTTPTFDFSVTNNYLPTAAPTQAVVFQFDTWQGKWQNAQFTATNNYTGTPAAPLSVGPHILYAYATDGSDSTSIMGGLGSSPIIGGIAAYYFFVSATTIPTVTWLSSDVNPVLAGHSVTFTAYVETSPSSTTIPQGSVQFFDGTTLLQTLALVGTGSASYTTSTLAIGTHPITATYVPPSGFSASTSDVLNEDVAQSLAFTSGTTTTFTAGIYGSFTVTTSGSPTPSIYRSGTLPTGVSFQDNGNGTATLSGTPAAGTPNTYPLTFTAHNGETADVTQSFSLVVNPPVLQSIAVTPNPASVVVGQTLQFAATGTYSDGSTQNLTGSATWHSSDTSKATISGSGVATGIAAGTTNITATSGSVTSTPSALTVIAGLTFSPTSIDFGTVTLWSEDTEVLTVTNNEKSSVSLTQISLGSLQNVGSKNLTFTTTCGKTLGAGKLCRITLKLCPSQTGSVSAVLSIQDSAPGSPQQVQIVAAVIAPKANLSASSLTFPAQTVKTTSAAKTVTVSNSGVGPLTISSVSLGGSDPSEFLLTNHCGPTLAQSSSCNISVSFKPKAKGTRTATLKITDNAQSGTQTVTLSGKGD